MNTNSLIIGVYGRTRTAGRFQRMVDLNLVLDSVLSIRHTGDENGGTERAVMSASYGSPYFINSSLNPATGPLTGEVQNAWMGPYSLNATDDTMSNFHMVGGYEYGPTSYKNNTRLYVRNIGAPYSIITDIAGYNRTIIQEMLLEDGTVVRHQVLFDVDPAMSCFNAELSICNSWRDADPARRHYVLVALIRIPYTTETINGRSYDIPAFLKTFNSLKNAKYWPYCGSNGAYRIAETCFYKTSLPDQAVIAPPLIAASGCTLIFRLPAKKADYIYYDSFFSTYAPRPVTMTIYATPYTYTNSSTVSSSAPDYPVENASISSLSTSRQ